LAKKSSRRPSTDPVLGPLANGPFPELAEALRSRIKPILGEWEKLVRRHVPPAQGVSFDEVMDSLPDILSRMSDALASGEPDEINRLMERSPQQGIHRFQLRYDVRDLATEDRMLRRLIVEHVEAAIGRRFSREEDTALHWAIDLMAQQAMVAFVNHQNERLRDAAEAELKYLSFLSHDLSGNLGNLTLWLQVLKLRLSESPQFAEDMSALDTAQQAILDTMGGMGKLLQAERLRHQGAEPKAGPVNLHDLAAGVVRQFDQQAQRKGVSIAVEIPPDATVTSDGELVRLVLQNLVGNALKYSTRGTVRVRAVQQEDGRAGAWMLSVSDEGPGIAPEHLERIFEAFQRGEVHGQQGVGLGLAIASRAAKLLNAKLTVESKPGAGSTFRLAFRPESGGASSVAASRRHPHRT
jgi:signal transduction histidine kinase